MGVVASLFMIVAIQGAPAAVVKPEVQAPSTLVVERVGVGGAGAVGLTGPIVAVRVSIPLGRRAGVDIDAGHVRRSPLDVASSQDFVAVQIRVLIHQRDTHGQSLYFLAGTTSLADSPIRTEVRWPDHTTTVQETPVSNLAPQVGVGCDWLSAHGVRSGIELASGGTELGGPRIYARAFVVWGPRMRWIGR